MEVPLSINMQWASVLAHWSATADGRVSDFLFRLRGVRLRRHLGHGLKGNLRGGSPTLYPAVFQTAGLATTSGSADRESVVAPARAPCYNNVSIWGYSY